MAGTAEVTNSVFCKPNKLPSSVRFSRVRPVASRFWAEALWIVFTAGSFSAKNAEISADLSRNSRFFRSTRGLMTRRNANSRGIRASKMTDSCQLMNTIIPAAPSKPSTAEKLENRVSTAKR